MNTEKVSSGIPWVLLPLPKPDALPLPHSMAAIQGYYPSGAHTEKVRRDNFKIIT